MLAASPSRLRLLLSALDEWALLVMAPIYLLLGMHCRGETELQRSENYDELHERFKEKQMHKKRAMAERLQMQEAMLLERKRL